jgi:hypothetical protein
MTVRIIHAVRQIYAGNIAVWLMNVLRHIDRQRCPFDFLVTIDAQGNGFGGEIECFETRALSRQQPLPPRARPCFSSFGPDLATARQTSTAGPRMLGFLGVLRPDLAPVAVRIQRALPVLEAAADDRRYVLGAADGA